MAEITNAQPGIVCTRCGHVVPFHGGQSAYTAHWQTHTQQIACPECVAVIVGLENWRTHAEEHRRWNAMIGYVIEEESLI